MTQLDYNSLGSAMQGYTPPSAQPQSNPLQSILPMALQIAGMIGGGAIAGPMGAAAGAGLGDAGGELLTGQALNPSSIGQSALFGLMPGMGGAKIASKAAEDVAAQDAAATAAKDATTGAVDSTLGDTAAKTAENTAGNSSTEGLLSKPTNIDPESNQGYVNFNKDASGNPVADTNNTFTPHVETPQVATPTPEAPGAAPTSAAPETPGTTPPTPQSPTPPVLHTSENDTFTQTNPQAYQSNLNLGQKLGQDMAIPALEQQIRQAGSNMSTAEVQQLARQMGQNGYSDLNHAASDGGLITGSQGILSNGLHDHINNADANGAVVDLSDYPNLIQSHVNDALSSGVLQPAQERALQRATQQYQNIIGGNAQDQDLTGALTLDQARNTPVSNAFKASQAFEQAAARQGKIAQGRGVSADGAKVLQNFYNNAAHDTMDRAFGAVNGGSAISNDNIDNMITQLKAAPFKNQTMQNAMINRLEQGKDGNLTAPQLRSLQSHSVKAMIAASPDQVSNLTNGLMSAGLSRSGIANAVINSNPGLVTRAKIGNALYKGSTPSAAGSASGGIINNAIKGGKGMSPLAKAALIAGIGGAGVLGVNGAATANQGAQAQALLNDPNYQKTQALLQQSNDLQRYLGQQGEIRSVFAPTFDANAGQAGTQGQAMLAAANQNQAARTAAANLLAARAQMGQGGLLGGALSIIPGTNQNLYAQQAGNAQAQLNALGIAGSAPSAAQSGGSIPALSSMAGNVGGF